MAGLCTPLPTLRRRPCGRLRTAQGRCGSLLLHRKGLAPSTPCRSPGALRNPSQERTTAQRGRLDRTSDPGRARDRTHRAARPATHRGDASEDHGRGARGASFGLVSKRDCPNRKRNAPARVDWGIVWFTRADCQIREREPQIWPPVGANQSQCPAPLGQRTVFSGFACILLRRAKNLIAPVSVAVPSA
jgi:hypothetical protein